MRGGSIALMWAASLIACADSGDGGSDSGSAPADGASTADGGRRALCPAEPNPACTKAADCGGENPKQSNCGGCRPYHPSICHTAVCSAPPLLDGGDPLNVIFQVGGLENQLMSFVGAVYTAGTAGGNTITCEDVYQRRVSPDEPCYNLVFSRGFAAIAQSGDTYTFTFTRFASGQRSLLLVYGYALENSEGDPIGVSCTPYDVGPPGEGRKDVPGDMMRRIQ